MAITQQIQTLNTEIDAKIKDKITLNWKEYLNTLDHKTISKLYKTMKSITLSNSSPIQIHVGITSTDDVPTNKQQANTLIKHFSHVSQLEPPHT